MRPWPLSPTARLRSAQWLASRGVFDSAYATSFGLTAGTSPALTVKAADVPAVAQDVTVVIGAASYTVTDVEPDGTGLILLRLDKSA